MKWIKLGSVIKHRKGFISISDDREYKLCRVQTNRKGVVLRELKMGALIRTKQQQVCKVNDFIVAEMDAKVGGYGFVPKDLNGSIVSSHYFLFDVDFTKIRKEYFEALLQTNIIQDQIIAKGSTNYSAVRPNDVLNWMIPILPIKEQISVETNFLNIRDASNLLAREIEHQKKLLSQLRQSILQEAIQGKLTEQWRAENPNVEPASELLNRIKAEKEQLIKDKKRKKEKPLPPIRKDEIPFELPTGWVWCRLGDIGQIKRGKSPKYLDDGVSLMLNQKCVRWFDVEVEYSKQIDYDWYLSVVEEYRVNPGDVLVNSTGEGTIGRSAIATMEMDGYLFDSHILKIESRVDPFYISTLINSLYGQNLVAKTKGAQSTKQTELGVGNLSSFNFPLPPITEQQAIVTKLKCLLDKCNELSKEIDNLNKHSKNLLKALFNETFEMKKAHEQPA